MRVLIIYDHIADDAAPDQADALVQARAIAAALEALGHEWMTLGVTLDLDAAKQAIARLQPDVAFNLVESLGGSGRLIHALPALLDVIGVPYTGATAEAQFITSHKPLAKQLMSAAGITTPQFLTLTELRDGDQSNLSRRIRNSKWILKSLWEHASIGLDANSVVEVDTPAKLLCEIEARLDQIGGAGFAEEYIDGREFNIGLLARDARHGTAITEPECLPPSEIVFHEFPAERPRIVNYACKWDEQSFEYNHTERVLQFGREDQSLLNELRRIALACWRAFGLRGYARVDFRVDAQGRPWVLEVNTNPCLSPDAGFAAALEYGKIDYARAIERILNEAVRAAVRSSGVTA